MGIHLSEQHKQELKAKLRTSLAKEGITLEQTVNYFYATVLEALEATSRWLKIRPDDLETLSRRFDKKIPEGDFRINFGPILVRRMGKVIHREWYSEDSVVKGWHRHAIDILRNRHKVFVPEPMVGELFIIGQEAIKKHGKA